jgi:hypothetical protein
MEKTIDVCTQCPNCKKYQHTTVPIQEWTEYQNGELAQNALRSLNNDEREAIISGLCRECWNELFLDPKHYL